MQTEIKFYSGDLLNGNINAFDTYEAAYTDYKIMAEDCAQTDRGDEIVSREQAVEESLAFHYVAKVTQFLDEDGDVVKEDFETLDGGDPDVCGYQQ
jgi:hypothetical protein